MPEMKERVVEGSFFEEELVRVTERRKIGIEKEKAILKLRKGLGEIICGRVAFPDEIEGKKIVLVPEFYPKADWVDDGTKSYKELSPTTLVCKPIEHGKRMNIILSSDIYPSGKQADIDNPESRPADFRVYREGLDYYFCLGRKGTASIYRLEGTEDEKRTPRDMSKRHIRILRDILNLVKSPKTDFFVPKYSIMSEYKKIT